MLCTFPSTFQQPSEVSSVVSYHFPDEEMGGGEELVIYPKVPRSSKVPSPLPWIQRPSASPYCDEFKYLILFFPIEAYRPSL